MDSSLTDKGTAIFAFAAYHQLESGQPVKTVVREDGKGHRADDAGVSELQSRGLAELRGNDIAFTDQGLAVLASAVEGLKRATAAG